MCNQLYPPICNNDNLGARNNPGNDPGKYPGKYPGDDQCKHPGNF